ncbi:STM4014 family protein [Paenibacillus sp. J5C_2022]|uniref:STM4014 family protein n=1 Tax=Paenibacillus sp. J5C2022 TaxID=2977129 RepID=UPI0021D2E02B|nr:STM4014 family protein [Paenibacillus sp. J5C2022]MCU6708267.1 STM4014 family protein [Paenibacillus sp. J5C2022]
MRELIVIGHPGSRRTQGIVEARRRLGQTPPLILSYRGLLQGKESLTAVMDRLETRSYLPILRLDSPGECFETERGLLALGAPDASSAERLDKELYPYGEAALPEPMSVRVASALREQRGRVVHPSQWYRGYCRLLGILTLQAEELGLSGCWWNHPADIAVMLDKRLTQQRLAGRDVPVPEQLGPPSGFCDVEALRETMKRERVYRVFIKMATGAGASGVVAYQLHPRTGAEVATTTLGCETFAARPPVFYNSRKLLRYTDSRSIERVVNWLFRHGAQVERWIPKAKYQGQVFDIRQLVMGGRACHRIARLSSTPITNLHLRAERMEADALGLPEGVLAAVAETAEHVMQVFPRSLLSGIDIVLGRHDSSPYVVDVNPYGDLLYHVRYKGDDTYTWELREAERLLLTRRPRAEATTCQTWR